MSNVCASTATAYVMFVIYWQVEWKLLHCHLTKACCVCIVDDCLILNHTVCTHNRSLARAKMVNNDWISYGFWHVCTHVCMTGRKCKNCSCFDSPYALRGCTRLTHSGKATIQIGQVDCDHYIRDQKSRSKNSQDKRTAARNKDHRHLRKKLPPCEYHVLL